MRALISSKIILSALIWCAMTPVRSQEVVIDDTLESAVFSATVDSGSPADITVDTSGLVLLDSGTAITINSDNDLIIFGEVTVENADGAVGVLGNAGFSSSIENDGLIFLAGPIEEDESRADNKSGILISGTGTFTGDLLNSDDGLISVTGNTSYGIEIDARLNGNLRNLGDIEIVGNRSVGIGVKDEVVGTFRNTGSITLFGNNNHGVRAESGAIVNQISNSGSIEVVGDGDNANSASAISILSGADVSTINNDEGSIVATFNGPEGSATAITDESGSLTLIQNTGLIAAEVLPRDDDEDADGDAIAIDLRTSNADVTLINDRPDDYDEDEDSELLGVIVGDIFFGSGSDTFDLRDGEVFGNVVFGAGNDTLNFSGSVLDGNLSFGSGMDTLIIDNGAEFTGRVTDSDGSLDIQVLNGSLNFSSTQTLNLTSAFFSSNAELGVSVFEGTATHLNASGAVTIRDGASITPIFENIVLSEAEFEIVTASDLILEGDPSSLLSEDLSFIYNVGIATSPSDDDILLLTVDRKSADEIGLSPARSIAYDPILEAVALDEELSVLANYTTEEDFLAGFDQFLPDTTGATLQFALGAQDGMFAAITGRVDTKREKGGPKAAVWFEEFGYYLDQDTGTDQLGYDGFGIGFVLGADVAAGPFDALGLWVSGASSEYEEKSGNDDPVFAEAIHVGAYGGMSMGKLDFDLSGNISFLDYSFDRNVILEDIERSTNGSWSGLSYGASFRTSYEFGFGNVFMRPSTGFDYLRIEEDSYEESGGGDGVDLFVDEKTTDSLRSYVGIDAGWIVQRNYRTIRPEVSVGWRQEHMADDPETTVRFLSSDETFTLTGDELADSGISAGVGVSLAGSFAQFKIGYEFLQADDLNRHAAQATLRLNF